uniref:Uncharacterized protein n=1 Tax=Arundo donax TaxID=35708 RepID=A0A0A9AN19_ARUDO
MARRSRQVTTSTWWPHLGSTPGRRASKRQLMRSMRG